VVVCRNNPSECVSINPANDDEFMNGVTVGPEGGIWSHTFTYRPLNTRQLPLYHQTIYLPPGGGALGATGDYAVEPTSWSSNTSNDRCVQTCFAMGDYARIGSNNYPGVGSPYVKSSGSGNDLFQVFAFDPQDPAPKNTFTPLPIYYALGADVRHLGRPVPPESLGIAPEKRRKLPGLNGR
jgi:hypothetical protein